MTSDRIVFLTILTLLIYATTLFFEAGLFLLPFGIFKLSLFFVAIALTALSKRMNLRNGILISATGCLAFSSHFFLQFFFSEEENIATIELITSISVILFSLLFLVWQVLVASIEKTWFRTLQIVNAFVMFTCILTNQYMWLLVPTFMWVLSVQLSKSVDDSSKSFVNYFLFIVVSTWISALYFGYESILGNL